MQKSSDELLIEDQINELIAESQEKSRQIEALQEQMKGYVSRAEYDEVNDQLIQLKAELINKDAEIVRYQEKKADYDEAVDRVKDLAKVALRRIEKHTEGFNYGERAQNINDSNTLSVLLPTWQYYENQAFEKEEAALRKEAKQQ